jgi:hypothetical protein
VFPIGSNVVGDATSVYNCHAYAWLGSSYYWLNDPTPLMTDGSYTRVGTGRTMQPGQIIYYTMPGNEHSGIVISTSGNTIRSKWGEWSLVEHARENCPYYYAIVANPFEFYE